MKGESSALVPAGTLGTLQGGGGGGGGRERGGGGSEGEEEGREREK